VVLYEEGLNEKDIVDAITYISNCDTLIVVGTSLMVYPAAGFLRYFKGRNLVLINKTKTSYDNIATLVINDDIIKIIEEYQIKLN
jgi:NAD-dependent deacetylase